MIILSEIYIVKKQEKSRPHRGDMLIYRIYYGDEIVYIGKTKQALSTRIKSHLYGRKYETRINIDRMTHIDYSVYKTPADWLLYHVYWVNKYHPRLNQTHKTSGHLTVSLPNVRWVKYTPLLLSKWREDLKSKK